eukprot:5871008-Pyramimonas_sp.AAC.1
MRTRVSNSGENMNPLAETSPKGPNLWATRRWFQTNVVQGRATHTSIAKFPLDIAKFRAKRRPPDTIRNIHVM